MIYTLNKREGTLTWLVWPLQLILNSFLLPKKAFLVNIFLSKKVVFNQNI